MNERARTGSSNLISRWWQKRQARIASLSEEVAKDDGPYFSGRGPLFALLLLALIGTFATGFLTYRHVLLAGHSSAIGESVLCRADGRVNCDAILQSEYADVLGYIPSSVLGLMGFAFVLWCLVNGLLNERVRKIAVAVLVLYFFTAIGFSWYYVYLLVFEVDYICTWCIVVHVVNLLSFIVLLTVAIRNRRKFLLPEISTRGERTYFVFGGVLLSLLVLAAAGQWEKALSFDDAKAKYEELANDLVVIRAVMRAAPDYDVPVSPADPVYGSRSASHAIIFFSDFQCPVCARTEKSLKDLVNLNPGALRLVYKNYPLSKECNPELLGDLHPMACQAAQAAYAAFLLGGDRAFWEYADMLFSHRAQLGNRPWLTLAEKVRLDPRRFQELMKPDSDAAKKVKEDMEAGIKLGIVATPQIFFEGKRIPENLRGAFLIDALEDLIRSGDPARKNFELKKR